MIWLVIELSLIINISLACLLVCFKPIHDPNSWFSFYFFVNTAWSWCFSLPFLHWYWIRIVVPINQPIILIILMNTINDLMITYWTFTNDNDSNLPRTRICSILIANWLLRIMRKNESHSNTVEWLESIDIWSLPTFVNPLINR